MSQISHFLYHRWFYFKSLLVLALAFAAIHQVFPLNHWNQLLILGRNMPMAVIAPMVLSALVTFGLASSWDYQQLRAQSKLLYAANKGMWRAVLLSRLRRALVLDLGPVQRQARRQPLFYLAPLSLAVGEFLAAPYLFRLPLHTHPLLGGLFFLAAILLFTGSSREATAPDQHTSATTIWRDYWRCLSSSPLLRQLLLIIPAGLALYLPLVQLVGMSVTDFVALFALAHVLGAVSRIPGGAGVFEGVFLFFAATRYPAAQVFAALIVYRSLYYVLPFLSSLAALIIVEVHRKKTSSTPSLFALIRLPQRLFHPLVSCLLLFLAANLLGLLPAPIAQAFVPPFPRNWPPYLANLAGVLVLLSWRCHWLRIDLAYHLVLAICGLVVLWWLGAAYYLSALVLMMLTILLLASKADFYRCNAALQGLLSRRRLGQYLFGVFLLFGPVIFLNETNDLDQLLLTQWLTSGSLSLWEQLLLITGLGLGVFALYPALMRCDLPLALPDTQALAQAQYLAASASETQPHLVLCGDKYLIWSPSRRSFIMFGKTPGHWLAMGDPVGEPSESKALILQLAEMADRAHARLAFYKVRADNLPLYADLGLAVTKLGEEAVVPLATFSLAGSKHLSIRNSYNRHLREGLIFEVIPADKVAALIPQLRDISASWMQQKLNKEKQFSLGFFDENYLKSTPLAIVRQGEKICAFANLWTLDNKAEIALDLMRYAQDAPKRVMEFLTLSLILWSQEQGYRQFNLGMAPLSGLHNHRLAPSFYRLGSMFFCHGTRFYNFEGVFTYKNKFTPQWQSRYLVGPSGWRIWTTIIALAKLIAGGAQGLLQK